MTKNGQINSVISLKLKLEKAVEQKIFLDNCMAAVMKMEWICDVHYQDQVVIVGMDHKEEVDMVMVW